RRCSAQPHGRGAARLLLHPLLGQGAGPHAGRGAEGRAGRAGRCSDPGTLSLAWPDATRIGRWKASMSETAAEPGPAIAAEADTSAMCPPFTLGQLLAYFLRLGTLGFGGPIALVGAMHRDLVERRAWVAERDYAEGLALAQ